MVKGERPTGQVLKGLPHLADARAVRVQLQPLLEHRPTPPEALLCAGLARKRFCALLHLQHVLHSFHGVHIYTLH